MLFFRNVTCSRYGTSSSYGGWTLFAATLISGGRLLHPVPCSGDKEGLLSFFYYFSHGVRLSPLGTAAAVWPIVPAPYDAKWQGKPKYSKKTCSSTDLSTTNPTWPDPCSNPGRRVGKPATNRPSYGTASTRGDSMNWTDLTQDREGGEPLVNTLMNARVPQYVGKFLSCRATGSFSRRAQLQGVCSYPVLISIIEPGDDLPLLLRILHFQIL
jgi:hypothetical protein